MYSRMSPECHPFLNKKIHEIILCKNVYLLSNKCFIISISIRRGRRFEVLHIFMYKNRYQRWYFFVNPWYLRLFKYYNSHQELRNKYLRIGNLI